MLLKNRGECERDVKVEEEGIYMRGDNGGLAGFEGVRGHLM